MTSHCWRAKRKRLKNTHEAKDRACNTETFGGFGKVCKLDEDILAEWIVNNSDLQSSHVTAMKKFDNDSPYHVYCHAVGLSLQFVMPDELKMVAVWRGWSDWRHEQLGKRLQTFRAQGGLLPSGQVNWKNKLFDMRFAESGILTHMTHLQSGVEAKIPKKITISKSYDFKNFWCEADAYLKMDPFPGVKITALFDKKKDVLGFVAGVNRKDCTEAIGKEVARHYREFMAKMEAVSGGGMSSSRVALQQQLATVDQEWRADSSTAARTKALALVANKAQKRKLSVA